MTTGYLLLRAALGSATVGMLTAATVLGSVAAQMGVSNVSLGLAICAAAIGLAIPTDGGFWLIEKLDNLGFATIGKSGRSITAKAEAIGRLVSLALRSGVEVRDIVAQIKGIRRKWGDNGILYFKYTRVKAFHIGVSGKLSDELRYRFMMSFNKTWGTVFRPLIEPLENFSAMAEFIYTPRKLDNWQFTASLAGDAGEIYGDNLGLRINVRKVFNVIRK